MTSALCIFTTVENQIVLSDAIWPLSPEMNPSDTLKQDVSLFLRSLQHFPHLLPLPFSLPTYKAFFVLVSAWRTEEPAIDAHHTIDCTRKWLEQSSATERLALDQQLVGCPEFWGGPCDLTLQLLALLTALYAGKDCAEEVSHVAHILVDSLERAVEDAENGAEQRTAILGLLGILLDAFAELQQTEAAAQTEGSIEGKAARLLMDVIWHSDDEFKVAVGILERLEARGGSFGFRVAAEIASTVVSRLAKELDDDGGSSSTLRVCALEGIATLFSSCLSMMLAVDETRALDVIDATLLPPLSSLLSLLLARTVDKDVQECLLELDVTATRLYKLCYEAVNGPLA